MKVPIVGHPTLYKDTESGVIIQNSSHDRDRYRAAKYNAMLQSSLQVEVAHLKKDVSDMKSSLDMILQLLTINKINR